MINGLLDIFQQGKMDELNNAPEENYFEIECYSVLQLNKEKELTLLISLRAIIHHYVKL